MEVEEWATIPEFGNYEISNLGNIYNVRLSQPMKISQNNYGYSKISLRSDWDQQRFTKSVAQMVAEAFVGRPNASCDTVTVLDGDLANVTAENLVWRPRWFAWKYSHQLKVTQPDHYQCVPVRNVVDNIEYKSIIEAGVYEGLLFDDIWRSTYSGNKVYPTGVRFEIVGGV